MTHEPDQGTGVKPQTLAGQMAEFRATLCDLFAEIAKTFRLRSYERAFRESAQGHRDWWHEWERP